MSTNAEVEQEIASLLPEHVLMTDYSDNTSRVYIKEKKRDDIDEVEIIVAIRGTADLSDLSDLYADAHIALGLSLRDTERYTSVRQKLIELHDLYEVDDQTDVSVRYTLTGHSLGGTIAQQLARDLPFIIDTVYTYNAGSSPLSALSFEGHTDARVFNYVSEYDPIAMFVQNRTETITPVSIFSAHSLSNFEADPGVLLLGEEAYDLRKKVEKRENLAMQTFDEAEDVQEYYTQQCPIDPHTGKR
eukprot:3397788-Pleurochrysis_carterae.AAC.1